MTATASAPHRNDPCPCGSGKKYKRCCLLKGGVETSRRPKIAAILFAVAVVIVIVLGLAVGKVAAVIAGALGVILVGSYMLFSDPPPPTTGGSPGAINFGN